MDRPQLMVIDDDADVREMLHQVLDLEGYEVIEASEGKQALELLSSLPTPTAILLDLRMPGLNGWQFRALQQRMPRLRDVPVLVISADRTSSTNELQALAARGYFRKPIDFNRLLQNLQEIVAERPPEESRAEAAR